MSRPLIVLLALAACAGDAPEAGPPAAVVAPSPATPDAPAPGAAAGPTKADAAPAGATGPEEPAGPDETAPGAVVGDPSDAAPTPEAPATEAPATEPPAPEAPAPEAPEPDAATDPGPAHPAEPTADAAPADGAQPTDGAQPAEEAAPAAPVDHPVRDYTIQEQSTLYVQVFKDPDTLAAALSHDHVVRAGAVSGHFTWDLDDPTACAVEVDVPVSRLIVDPPKLRARVGLEGTLSDKQRGDVAKNMRARSQLWAGQHDTITFRSTGCEDAGNGDIRVRGDLTIRGKAVRKSVVLALAADETSLQAKGTFKARATDFGFSPFTAMAGALKNRDQMTFTVRLVASAW
jgi:polyisoprenoid-binding protein YceI